MRRSGVRFPEAAPLSPARPSFVEGALSSPSCTSSWTAPAKLEARSAGSRPVPGLCHVTGGTLPRTRAGECSRSKNVSFRRGDGRPAVSGHLLNRLRESAEHAAREAEAAESPPGVGAIAGSATISPDRAPIVVSATATASVTNLGPGRRPAGSPPAAARPPGRRTPHHHRTSPSWSSGRWSSCEKSSRTRADRTFNKLHLPSSRVLFSSNDRLGTDPSRKPRFV